MNENPEPVEEPACAWREKVSKQIAALGSVGATCEELEDLWGALHQNISARIWELHRQEEIHDSGQRRVNRSGREAIVWVYGAPPKPQLTMF